MKRLGLWLLFAAGCSEPSELALRYTLVALAPMDVYRLETLVAVDPADGRNFFADSPFRTVAPGIGYEVRDFDGTGKRRMLITHDVALGYEFGDHFTFTLLPPSSGAPPPLLVVARAAGMSNQIGSSSMLKGSFGAGHSLRVEIMDVRCNGAVCGAGEICCSGSCTNIASDADHCGACETACGSAADSCTSGTCRCGSGSACATAEICCSGLGCVDLASSAFNCGSCGHACNPGESCEAGVCKCAGGAACAADGLCCAGGCSTDGTCPCGSMPCPTPNVCCDAASSKCVDVRSSAADCGACGVSCDPPLSCQNGACTCQGQLCGGGDSCCSTGCAHLSDDAANCGACGNECAFGETCVAGVCKCGSTQCSGSQGCCGGECVDTQGDSMNCGGCNIICNPGESCLGGECVCPGTSPTRACTSPPESCCAASDRDSGGCFNIASSHDHCGACGIACKANEECQNSHCVATSCLPACTNMNMCVDGDCRCNGSGGCDDPKTCCASGCKDTHDDRNNCGNCGVLCTDPQLCCNSGCVPRDAAHCQACDLGCPAVAGRNVYCCGSNNSWGCVPDSINNCGGCGKQCLTGQVCCSGSAGSTSSLCKTENDFACGLNCLNCAAANAVCCGHSCCTGNCCGGSCCHGLCVGGACIL